MKSILNTPTLWGVVKVDKQYVRVANDDNDWWGKKLRREKRRIVYEGGGGNYIIYAVAIYANEYEVIDFYYDFEIE